MRFHRISENMLTWKKDRKGTRKKGRSHYEWLSRNINSGGMKTKLTCRNSFLSKFLQCSRRNGAQRTNAHGSPLGTGCLVNPHDTRWSQCSHPLFKWSSWKWCGWKWWETAPLAQRKTRIRAAAEKDNTLLTDGEKGNLNLRYFFSLKWGNVVGN